MRKTYGKLLPGMKLNDLAGKLIVLEGTDGAGRTTQINMLKPWLEELGHAVLDTGMTRSPLAGEGIRRAKEGNNLGRVTQSLFYATDFIDRLENEIVPALRAGFIVLTDRYIYSLMARAIVRGMDAAWIRSIFSAALVPDAVFYLRLSLEELIPRVVFSRGFDYWESGMDVFPGHDMYESFGMYQTALLAEFERLGTEYDFQVIDASAEPRVVFAQLKAKVLNLLEQDSRATYLAKTEERLAIVPSKPAAPALPPSPLEREPVVAATGGVNREIDLLFQSMVAYYSGRPHGHAHAGASTNRNGHANGNGHRDLSHD
jgi:dTMP kinase